MAYLKKETCAQIRAKIREEFPATDGWKISVVNDNLSVLDVTILSAPVRFCEKDSRSISEYHLDEYKHADLLKKLVGIMNGDFLPEGERNFNKSESQVDYFHVGWYIRLSQGAWDRPFVLATKQEGDKRGTRSTVKGKLKILDVLMLNSANLCASI